MCVSFRVSRPHTPDSNAEKNIQPQSSSLVPRPPHEPLMRPRGASPPYTLKPRTALAPPASADRWVLFRGASCLPSLEHRR